MNNLPTPLIAAAVFALLFVLERFFPFRNTTRSLVARLFVNLAILVFTFITAFRFHFGEIALSTGFSLLGARRARSLVSIAFIRK
jgi:protein-S-isoprenylcysteine O-methyltransferase Ste14